MFTASSSTVSILINHIITPANGFVDYWFKKNRIFIIQIINLGDSCFF